MLLLHPLIRTKSRLEQASKAGITLGRVFGSRECERAWVALMRQYNLVLQPGERESLNESEGEGSTLANRAKEARGLPPKTDRASQLVLAQYLYAERIREIQESIKMKEQKFKALVADIEALNSGAMDEKLEAEVQMINAQVVTPTADNNARPPPKDRSVATPVTPGSGPAQVPVPGPGTPRTTRISRSGSIVAAPNVSDILATPNIAAKDAVEEVSADVEMSTPQDLIQSEAQAGAEKSQEKKLSEAQDLDTTMAEAAEPMQNANEAQDVGDEAAGAAASSEVEMDGAESGTASRKQTRSSRRGRGESETGNVSLDSSVKKKREASGRSLTSIEPEHVPEEEEIIAEEEEGEEETAEDGTQKKAEPRRSRRSDKKGSRPEEESAALITPVSAVTPSTKNRLEALRSRETSGASQEGEEEDITELDTSRSTAERRASRTSTSPVSTRKGRGASRPSSNLASASRRSRGGSNNSRTEVDLTEAEREKAKRKNEKVLMMLLNEVSNHTHGNLFHTAIKEQDAPDYYALVRHPLDLKTIKIRIREGGIVNSVQLRRALNQMFANSLIYNRPGTEIHRMALEMRDAAEEVSH